MEGAFPGGERKSEKQDMRAEHALIAALRSCAKKKDLYGGTRVHADLLKRGLLETCSCALISMYAKCAAPETAYKLLIELPPVEDVFTWTALIMSYTQQGQGQNALICFEKMQGQGLSADAVTFSSILKACGSIGALEKGEEIHHLVAKCGFLAKNVVLGTALIDMYVKCGALAKAQGVLKVLSIQDAITWNTLLSGYVQHGKVQDALNFFDEMQHRGFSPNASTFICMLKVYGSMGAQDKGQKVHDEIVRQGLLRDNPVLGISLVNMYIKCNTPAKAQQVLKELTIQDVILWSALISKYVELGQSAEALNCFDYMEHEGVCCPDAVTFICILRACGTIRAADKGEHIHDAIAKRGLLKENMQLGTALVDMYAKCGKLAKAQEVLNDLPVRDVVSWSSLIAGYVQQGQGQEALNCFERMQCEGHIPNAVTFLCILQACGKIGAIDKGEEIHEEIVKKGLLHHNVALGNALMDMYIKCGALARAQEVLEELPVRDVISWNTLIAGYAQQGQGQDALNCLKRMRYEGLYPDGVTFTCILKACGSIGAIDKGEQVHDEISKQGLLGSDIVLGTALLDMYAKCGALSKAQQVLEQLPAKDIVTWSALIAGYAEFGHGSEALKCFKEIQSKGLSPDSVAFSCLLNAFSHSGLAKDGHVFFANMEAKFGVKPSIDHYNFMVDLFAHAGDLDKAVAMVQRMPSSNDAAVWSTLLGVCQEWGNLSIGRWAFEHALQVDRRDATPYVCMAKIYAAAGMKEDADSIQALRVSNKA